MRSVSFRACVMRIGCNFRRLQDVTRSLLIKKRLSPHDRDRDNNSLRLSASKAFSVGEARGSPFAFYRELYARVKEEKIVNGG